MRTVAKSKAALSELAVAIPFWKNASPKNVDSLALPQPNEVRSERDAVTMRVWSSCSG